MQKITGMDIEKAERNLVILQAREGENPGRGILRLHHLGKQNGKGFLFGTGTMATLLLQQGSASEEGILMMEIHFSRQGEVSIIMMTIYVEGEEGCCCPPQSGRLAMNLQGECTEW